MEQKGSLPFLIERLEKASGTADATRDHLWYAVRNAVNPRLLVSNLAEALRLPAAETEKLLVDSGFGDLVAQTKVSGTDSGTAGSFLDYSISSQKPSSPFPDLFSIEFAPSPERPLRLPSSMHEAVTLVAKAIVDSVETDAFLELYRKDVFGYHRHFADTDAKEMDRYIEKHFGMNGPKYVVNSGIGANEQFNHFVAHINNNDPNRRVEWLVIDSPRHLAKLPPDADIGNTLFMEFSRSGKTEETLKIHEYTPRDAKRIVFANSGPLRDIGARDNNLLLELPDRVSGRFGRNKTPILLAPMHVAGMDTKRFWRKIEEAVSATDLTSPDNLALAIAQFIYLHQQVNGANHIYFGCNDDFLAASADEFLQFWNEGVNKDGNDISMSRYFGLLRDSHLHIEGILANSKTKMGIFLLREKMSGRLPPMTSWHIDPINKEHAGLCFGDEERMLADANYQRFSEVMPTIKIAVKGDLSIDHSAVLGQLWTDITFCYSRLVNVDPGSNPEVKLVRDRSAMLLANKHE